MPYEQVVELSFALVVKAELADALQAAAESRDQEPAALMCDIIERVLLDGLVAAVLDD